MAISETPVSVDAEAGYGLEPTELVAALQQMGAAGCSLEDQRLRGGRPPRSRPQRDRSSHSQQATRRRP